MDREERGREEDKLRVVQVRIMSIIRGFRVAGPPRCLPSGRALLQVVKRDVGRIHNTPPYFELSNPCPFQIHTHGRTRDAAGGRRQTHNRQISEDVVRSGK